MDLTGQIAPIHMRTDANNLVTTAKTTHLPEQEETIHMVNQLRHEACSGQIQDLAHVISTECLSDGLTKKDAKTDVLTHSVNIGRLLNVDKHPPFREIMRNKHKAYVATPDLVCWIMRNLRKTESVCHFLAVPVAQQLRHAYSVLSFCS